MTVQPLLLEGGDKQAGSGQGRVSVCHRTELEQDTALWTQTGAPAKVHSISQGLVGRSESNRKSVGSRHPPRLFSPCPQCEHPHHPSFLFLLPPEPYFWFSKCQSRYRRGQVHWIQCPVGT